MADTNDAWPPAQDFWEHSNGDDGRHVFKSIRGNRPLQLGDIPDYSKITVLNPTDQPLTITATSARYTEITIAERVRSLDLEGKFNHITVKGRTNATFAAEHAPTKLILLEGDWRLDNRSDNDRLNVVIDSGDNVAIRSGNPATITGKCRALTLGDLTGQPDVDVDAAVTPLASCMFGHLKCARLTSSSPVRAASISATGQRNGWSIECESSIEADAVHAHGSVRAHGMQIGHLRIESGHAWIAQQAVNDSQYGALDAIDTAEDGPSARLHPARPQPSQFETVNIEAGSLHGADVTIVNAGTITVRGLLHLQTLSADEPLAVSANHLLISTVAAPTAALTIEDQVRITHSAVFDTLECGPVWFDRNIKCSAVTADNLVAKGTIAPASEHLRVHARRTCMIAASASISGHLHLTGESAVIAEGADVADVHIEPEYVATAVELAGSTAKLNIAGTAHPVTLSGTGIATTGAPIMVTGHVEFTPAPPARSKDPIKIPSVTWADTTNLSVKTNGAPVDIIKLSAAADAASLTVHTSGNDPVSVGLEAPVAASITAKVRTNISATATPNAAVALTLAGTRQIALNGTFTNLEITSRDCDLLVPEHTVIEDISGDVSIQHLAGSMTSVAAEHPPARLIRLYDPSASATPVGPSARITGLDLTQLPFQEVDELDAAEYVEPDRTTVVTYATEKNLSSAEVRARAQWMLNLHQLVEQMAVPGTVRSAVAWAAARLQHRATKRGKRSWESRVRTVHRAVGYGYRWWPPMLLWLAAAAVVSLFSLDSSVVDWAGACDRSAEVVTLQTVDGVVEFTTTTESECAATFGAWFSQFWATLFFPFRLLRLSPEANVFAYLPAGVQPIAGVAIGLPFVFLLISIRRFFKLTHDG